MNNKPEYLSAEGLERLRAELGELVHVKRPEVAQRIHDAKEHGDVTENAEYEDAKNEQAFIEGRIQALEAVIKNAVLIDENHSRTHVQIGSTVVIEGDNGKEKYTIVGSVEAAPEAGRISNESPVGRALLGRKKGERGDGLGARGRFHLHDRQHPLTGRWRPRPCGAATRRGDMFWADELGIGPPWPAGRQRFEDAVGHRPRREPERRRPPRRRSIARSWAPVSRAASSTASTTSTRWTHRRS